LGNSPQSYGISPAISGHTVLPVAEHARLNPSQQGWHSIYLLWRTEGWVELGGWLHTEMVYLHADGQLVTHPSTNQARCRARTLIETNALTLS